MGYQVGILAFHLTGLAIVEFEPCTETICCTSSIIWLYLPNHLQLTQVLPGNIEPEAN